MGQVATRWDENRPKAGLRWWRSIEVHRHVNAIVCGESCDGKWEGFGRRLAQMAPPGGFRRGVSVACGSGMKEMALVEAGVVQQFDLYEVSRRRVEVGTRIAAERGLGDRITFRIADALADRSPNRFDLVHWNNALHHMMDTPAAVEWSWEVLEPGGTFAMNDFVGATRFQWSDHELDLIHAMRSTLPPRLLAHPEKPDALCPTRLPRPGEAGVYELDPSEAADSERILPAIRKFFLDAEVKNTGGVYWQTGLSRILGNFLREEEGPARLEEILLADRRLAEAGVTHYAVALATKRELTEEQRTIPLPERRPLPATAAPIRRGGVGRRTRRALSRIRRSLRNEARVHR